MANETVLECVIRCQSPADAEWVLKMLRSSVAEHSGIRLDVAAIFPASIFDGEVEIEGVPA